MRQRRRARLNRLQRGLHIDAGRGEESVGHRTGREGRVIVPAKSRLLHDLAHQRIAVGMHAGGGEADQNVAGRHGARQIRAPLHCAYRKPCKVEVALGVKPRHLRRLAADERATRLTAAFRDSLHQRRALIDVQRAGREIVEEEKRLRPLTDQIVHAHRHKVDPDRVHPARVDGQLQLGPDAICRGDEDRVAEPGALQVEHGAKPAQPIHHARSRGGGGGGLDPLDKRIAGVDIDAGVLVGEGVGAIGHGASPESDDRALSITPTH